MEIFLKRGLSGETLLGGEIDKAWCPEGLGGGKARVRVSGGGHWGDTTVTLIQRPRRRKEDKEFGLDSLRLECRWEYQAVVTGGH